MLELLCHDSLSKGCQPLPFQLPYCLQALWEGGGVKHCEQQWQSYGVYLDQSAPQGLQAGDQDNLEGSTVPMHSSKVFQLVNSIDTLLVGVTSPVSQPTLQLDIVLLLLMLIIIIITNMRSSMS